MKFSPFNCALIVQDKRYLILLTMIKKTSCSKSLQKISWPLLIFMHYAGQKNDQQQFLLRTFEVLFMSMPLNRYLLLFLFCLWPYVKILPISEQTQETNNHKKAAQHNDIEQIEQEDDVPESTSAKEKIPSFPSLSPPLKKLAAASIILFLMLPLIMLLAWFMKKTSLHSLFRMNHTKNIKILERRILSPHTYLYHIQIGDKQLIISESKQSVKVITPLDWPEKDPSH